MIDFALDSKWRRLCTHYWLSSAAVTWARPLSAAHQWRTPGVADPRVGQSRSQPHTMRGGLRRCDLRRQPQRSGGRGRYYPRSQAAQMREVAERLAGGARPGPVFISIAAGVPIGRLESWLGADAAVVRCMPNTPALVQAGAAALCANANVTSEQRAQSVQILEAVGIAVWLEDEAQMDAVTALSGSGPAILLPAARIVGGGCRRARSTARNRAAAGFANGLWRSMLSQTHERGSGNPAAPGHIPRRHYRTRAGIVRSRRFERRRCPCSRCSPPTLTATRTTGLEQMGGSGYFSNAGVFLINAVFGMYIFRGFVCDCCCSWCAPISIIRCARRSSPSPIHRCARCAVIFHH